MPAQYTEYLLTLTVGLVMLTTITIAFQGLHERVEMEALPRELEEWTQGVAQFVIEVYMLGQEAEGADDWLIEVQVELPSDIGGHFFQLKVVDSTDDQRPDSIHGFLLTKNEISTQVDLRPISDQIYIQGGFQSIHKRHVLRYYPKELAMELIDL